MPNTPTHIPEVVFKVRMQDEAGDFHWQDVASKDLFAGKRVVVFALPGAFTPTCSSVHLPGYEVKYEEVKAAGIDEIYCLSINDSFVMNKWAKEMMVENVKMLPDGSGDFTRGMGMLVKKENLGFGNRSWRYSMVVNDGAIEKIFIEPGYCDNCEEDPFEVSDVSTMLEYLNSK